jgi:hypothetical protein
VTWRLSTSEDFELVLQAAERLLRQAEERKRHEDNKAFTLVSILIGVSLSFIASFVTLFRFVNLAYVIPAIAAAIIMVLLGVALVNQRRRDPAGYVLRLATQLASMASEVLLDVAERERWSYVRLEAAKLRLSAFPILNVPEREPRHGDKK